MMIFLKYIYKTRLHTSPMLSYQTCMETKLQMGTEGQKGGKWREKKLKQEKRPEQQLVCVLGTHQKSGDTPDKGVRKRGGGGGGPLKGWSPCRLSSLRNASVACLLSLIYAHVSCRI